MYGYLFALGVAMIIIGFSVLMIYAFMNTAKSQGAERNATSGFGGLIMIGPVPIAFGSSPGMVVVAEAMAIVLIIIAIIFFFLFSRR